MRVKREETLLPFNGMFNGPINACKHTSVRNIKGVAQENDESGAHPGFIYARAYKLSSRVNR